MGRPEGRVRAVSDWLRVLFDPRPLARGGHRRDTEISVPELLAILLLGDIDSFARRAAEFGFPLPSWLPTYPIDAARGTPPRAQGESEAFTDQTLLEGTLAFVAGRPDSRRKLKSVIDQTRHFSPNESTTIRDRHVFAVILAALAASDTEDTDDAVALLGRAIDEPNSEYSRAALRLHRAAVMQQISELRPQSSMPPQVDSTEAILQQVLSQALPPDKDRPAGAVPLDALLHAVAHRALTQFNESRGLLVGRETEQDYAARRLLEREEDIYFADLANSLLKQSFEQETQRARVRVTVAGRTTDRTTDTLSCALLRARCIADPVGMTRVRRLLARHQIIHSFALYDADPASAALYSLVRSGDKSGVSRSVWILWTTGPQQAVKRVAERVTEEIEQGAAFSDSAVELLRVAADVLETQTVDRLVETSVRAVLSHTPLAVWKMDILRLCTALCAAANDEAQSTLARLVIMGDRNQADDSFFGRLAAQIRWAAVDVTTRKNALVWARSAELPARSHSVRCILEGLAESNRRQTLDMIRRIAKQYQTVEWAATFWNVGMRAEALYEEDTALIEQTCLNAMLAIQDDASRGSFSVGTSFQASALLARVAIFTGREGAWRYLADFITDDKVQIDDKAEAVQLIVSHASRLPAAARRRLRAGIAGLSRSSVFTRDDGSVFYQGKGLGGLGIRTSEQLFLSIAVRTLSRSDSLSAVAELTASRNPRDRLVATRALSLVATQGSFNYLVPLALALCSDDDTEVRADAILALAKLRPVSGWQRQAVSRALEDALTDPGILIPLRALGGLLQCPPDDSEQSLLEGAERLTRHNSVKVRIAARRVVSVGTVASTDRSIR